MATIPDATIEIGEIKPQKWEYMTFFLGESDDPDDKLNGLGRLGWELVTVLPISIGLVAYFKRPIWSD